MSHIPPIPAKSSCVPISRMDSPDSGINGKISISVRIFMDIFILSTQKLPLSLSLFAVEQNSPSMLQQNSPLAQNSPLPNQQHSPLANNSYSPLPSHSSPSFHNHSSPSLIIEQKPFVASQNTSTYSIGKEDNPSYSQLLW